MLEPCAPVGLPGTTLVFGWGALFFAMHFVLETQKSIAQDHTQHLDDVGSGALMVSEPRTSPDIQLRHLCESQRIFNVSNVSKPAPEPT